MKRFSILSVCLLLCAVQAADVIKVQIEYDPAVGAHVTVPDVEQGLLQVQRSTDLTGTNWVTFAIASVPFPSTNTWRFHDYLSLSNSTAFYRAIFTKP